MISGGAISDIVFKVETNSPKTSRIRPGLVVSKSALISANPVLAAFHLSAESHTASVSAFCEHDAVKTANKIAIAKHEYFFGLKTL
jgi:S-adenosylmethionine:tRNA-ribosyltransferase-isomerase (queuine synthetase)